MAAALKKRKKRSDEGLCKKTEEDYDKFFEDLDELFEAVSDLNLRLTQIKESPVTKFHARGPAYRRQRGTRRR